MFEFIILIVISAVILKVIRSILKPFQDKIKNESDNARKISNDKKAFKRLMEEESKTHNPEIQFQIAHCYAEGIGVEQDETETFGWIKKSAEQGFGMAEYFIGEYYLDDSSPELNKKLGIEYLEKAISHGCNEAYYKLGTCYLDGNGVKKDEAKGIEFIKKADETGIEDAKEWISENKVRVKKYEKEKDAKKHFDELIEEEEKMHDAIAQYKIANCYANNNGVEKDEAKAFEWYEKSAAQGNAEAQIKVAICYDEGKGTSVDKEKAAVWYRKSAEHGNETAKAWIEKYENTIDKLLEKEAETHDAEIQYKIAACYANGDGVEKDETKAFKWYKKSAEQEFAAAQFELANCYAYGRGIEKDIQGSVPWMEKAAKNGNSDAQLQYGGAYFHGVPGVISEDKKEAFKWYHISSENGNHEADYEIGRCYFYGLGVKKSKREAVKWLEKGIDAPVNGSISLFLLGLCFCKGEEIEINMEKAIDYLIRSGKRGNADAYYRLGDIYFNGENGIRKNMDKALEYFLKAAEGNCTAAFPRLAERYYWTDKKLSEKYLNLAIESGEDVGPLLAYLRDFENMKRSMERQMDKMGIPD